MSALIVTHQSPDLDAVGAVWLLKRFLTATWGEAKVAFVNAGATISPERLTELGLENLPAEQIIHVDTGMGEFDHHQEERGGQRICASSLVFDHICGLQNDKKNNQALQILVEYITQIDHFEDCYWSSEIESWRDQFLIHNLLTGASNIEGSDDYKLLEFGFSLLDAAYSKLRSEVSAQKIIAQKGQRFKVAGQQALALASSNSETEKRAQKLGYKLIIRKDEKLGSVRIKATPQSNIDLTPVYEAILEQDKVGDWFLHNSKRMLLNGSVKAKQNPTPLSLTQVVKLVKSKLS